MILAAARLKPSRRLSELSRWSQASQSSVSPSDVKRGRRRASNCSRSRPSKRWNHIETSSQTTDPTNLSELSTNEGESKRTSALGSLGTSLGASIAASPRGNDYTSLAWDLDRTGLTDALEALANAGVDAEAFFSEALQHGVEGLPHGLEAYMENEQMRGYAEWTSVWDDDSEGELNEAESDSIRDQPSLSPQSLLSTEPQGGRRRMQDLLLSLPPLPALTPSLELASHIVAEEMAGEPSSAAKDGSTFLQRLQSSNNKSVKVGVREDGEILFVPKKAPKWHRQEEELPLLHHHQVRRREDTLVHVSPVETSGTNQADSGVDALLWELRSRLAAVGVRPDVPVASRRKTRMQRAPKPERVIAAVLKQIRHVRCRRNRRKQMRYASFRECRADKRDLLHMCRLAQMAEPAKHVLSSEKDLKFQLTHVDWLELCGSLRFNLEEAEELFAAVADRGSGLVDLPHLFDILRTLVGPDISLERFLARLVLLFGSPEAAFESVALEHVGMGWPEFQQLTQTMAVNERNALQIWQLLAELQHDLDDKEEVMAVAVDLQGVVECTITKEIFARQVTEWMPHTSLDKLSLQLYERYGSIAQGMKALQRRGVHPTRLLSPRRLQKGLHDIGARGCNAEQILGGARVVLARFSPRCERKLTLEDLECILLILEMCAGFGQQEQHAAVAVREDTAQLWTCLHKLKLDLSDRHQENIEAVSFAAARAPLRNQSRGRKALSHAVRMSSQSSEVGARKPDVTGSVRSRVYERSPAFSAWTKSQPVDGTRKLRVMSHGEAGGAAQLPSMRHRMGGA